MDKDDNIFVEFSEDFKTDATLYRESKTGKFQVKVKLYVSVFLYGHDNSINIQEKMCMLAVGASAQKMIEWLQERRQ